MEPKPARDYVVGEPVPMNYPWEPTTTDRYLAEINPLDDGVLEFITSYGLKFTAHRDEIVGFPRRIEGLPNATGPSNPPLAITVAIGDILPDGWRVEHVVAHSPQLMAPGRWRLRNLETNEVMWEIAGPYDILKPGQNTWTPTRSESPVERARHPWRGPYKDLVHEGVEYFFAVHPTGQGRWRKEVPLFEHKTTPGQYRSRPPKLRAAWKILEFGGALTDPRHTDDPQYK